MAAALLARSEPIARHLLRPRATVASLAPVVPSAGINAWQLCGTSSASSCALGTVQTPTQRHNAFDVRPEFGKPSQADLENRLSSLQISTVSNLVRLSKQRHNALLEAEIVHFARALTPHAITLRQILAQTDASSFREYLLVELPIRYARRVALLESLEVWNASSQLRKIRSIYNDAFRRLRMLSHNDVESFRKTLQDIKVRHSNILMSLIRGIQTLKSKGMASDERINEFLDDFLRARIGTDILCSQYLALTRPGNATSVVDPQCDPAALTRAAAADASRLCKYHFSYAPPVEVTDVAKVRLPFIPQYIKYIMFEITKNALRAVAERHGKEDSANHPIRITVCGDEVTVVIRVSDAGGGIPLDELPRAWSYLYTTAEPVEEENSESDDSEDECEVSPMAGFGCGLPLSRTYASYVGGRLEVNVMPEYGTDVYLYLDRLGDTEEIFDNVVLPSRKNLVSWEFP